MRSACGPILRASEAQTVGPVGFGTKEQCGDVPNRLDAPDGWNFLMRVYRPGKSVLSGSYKLPDAVPFKK